MNTVTFTDVHLLNLRTLIIVRDCINADKALACCQFGLHADQASVIAALSIDRILSVVANVGAEALFLPRKDLLQLLELPPSLSGPILSAHPPQDALPTAPSLRNHEASLV